MADIGVDWLQLTSQLDYSLMLNVALREDDRIFYCRIEVEFEKRGKKDQIEREVVFDVGLFNLWMVELPEY